MKKYVTPTFRFEQWKSIADGNLPLLRFNINKVVRCSNILLVADSHRGTIPGYYIECVAEFVSPALCMRLGDTIFVDMHERPLFAVTNFYDTGLLSQVAEKKASDFFAEPEFKADQVKEAVRLQRRPTKQA